MATYTLTPAQLKGAGIYNSFEIPAGGGVPSFLNTKSIQLDGIDDFITMGNVLNMANDGTDAYSISVWFKFTDNTSATSILVSKQQVSAWYDGYSISVRGDLKRLNIWLGTLQGSDAIRGYATIPTINNGNWHNIVLTYDGSQDISGFNLYYDDSPQSLTTQTNNTPIRVASSSDFMIGARGTSGSPGVFFNGNIDEVSYFNSELSVSDITSIYNGGEPNDISSLSPLSWWRCGDGDTSPTLTDNGSGGNDGTMSNFTTFSTDVPT